VVPRLCLYHPPKSFQDILEAKVNNMTDYTAQSDNKDKKLEDGIQITATPTNDGTSTPITLSPEELAAYKLDRISAMTAEEISAYEIDPVVEAQVRWQYDKVGMA